jgi:hypothetical protein
MKKMLPFYLVYLIIVTMIVTGVSFSKYGTIVDGADSARVAKPVLRYVPLSATYNGVALGGVSGGLEFDEVEPGDELIYYFEIRNFENEELNEVLLKYNIEISVEPEGVLPLEVTVTPSAVYPSAGSGWTLLNMGEEITHSYTLTIHWDEAETGSEYGNQEQVIRITINAEQVD